MKVALVVGSAACVYQDLERAPPIRDDLVIAVNEMILDCPRTPLVGVTLHAEYAARYAARGVPVVSYEEAPGVNQVWIDDGHRPGSYSRYKHGSSGLYATGYALEYLKVDLVILAGVPLDESPHYYNNEDMTFHLDAYREFWRQALPHLRGRVVSLSGWTRHLLES